MMELCFKLKEFGLIFGFVVMWTGIILLLLNSRKK
jgi:hypothetical protein